MGWGTNEPYQGIEEKGPNTLRHLKDLKLGFEIPSESCKEFGEDLVCILWERDGLSVHLQERFITMNCRRGEAPAAAQDSSYVGKEGEKRGTSFSSSATRPASAGWPSTCPIPRHLTVPMHYLIAHQYLSQEMDCKVSKHQRIFVFLRI